MVLWADPRHVWLCRWFVRATEDPSGGVCGSMDRPEACVAM